MIVALLAVLGALILVPLMVTWDGIAMSHIWNMFMPQLFSLPHLSIPQSIAVSLAINVMIHKGEHREMTKEEKMYTFAGAFFRPLVAIAMAHLLTYFM